MPSNAISDSSFIRWQNGRWEYLFPDGLWRYPVPIIVDGEPTFTWSDGTP